MIYSDNFLDSNEKLIRDALLIRRVEQKLLQLFAEGKINGTVHTCIGQELSGVILAANLMAEDFIVSNHRGHGHYLARTGDVRGLFAEVMGRESGLCGGMGGSQHLCADHYLSNGIQGGMTPIAAGVALAHKLNQTDIIAVAFIGDGTLGQGVLYETLNLCGIWRLPVLFILENNGYAQSTSMNQTFCGDLGQRITGFGLKFTRTNTWDWDGLNAAMSQAVRTVRTEGTPCFLEVETYRLMPHSKGDDNRSVKERELHADKDLLTQLINRGVPRIQDMLAAVDAQIASAVLEAEQSEITKTAIPAEKLPPQGKGTGHNVIKSEQRYNDLIYNALKMLFYADDRVIMLGEDIEYTTQHTALPYGGAFRVSKDLSALFQSRVLNTPISESAIVGIGTGLALAGMRPIVEIMFGDFITLAFDQIINHATKFCTMFGRRVEVPLIIRTPMGGRRGYGPTHSQSLEKHLLGVPNLRMVALHHRMDPRYVYEAIHASLTSPVLVLENKVLYTQHQNDLDLPGFKFTFTDELMPTLLIRPGSDLKPDLTLVCYGGMLKEVELAVKQAYEDEEIIVEIICPTMISPLSIKPIIASVNSSQRLLVAEEGNYFASLGSEVIAQIMEQEGGHFAVKRLGFNDVIPCSYAAENNLLPNQESVFSAILELYHE